MRLRLVVLGLHVAPAALLALALGTVVDGSPALIVSVLTVRPKEGSAVGHMEVIGGFQSRGIADEREAGALGHDGGRHRTTTVAEAFV